MADINLTQAEADALIALPKKRTSEETYEFPFVGGSLSIPLESLNKKEQFLLDVSRGRIDLMKGKLQNRARHVVVLVRLDFGGAPHRNPDGAEIPSPHLHVYREGYGDKWAILAPKGLFPDTSDLWRTLGDFMGYCKIIDPPKIERGLFS